MSLSLHQASVGAFQATMTPFLAILAKAAAHAEAAKFDPAVYATLRLRPNMLAFPRQVQIFCDQAKNSTARLAAIEPPRYEDNETTLDDLKGRIEKTLAFIGAADRSAVEAGAEREIVFPLGPNKARMIGRDYLVHYVLPNYYFHLTTAYDLLRQAGVDIGKRDFLGQPPGLTLI
ncbi:MAG: DUF1993 domain-containing protein [Pseudomonadota bacterium]|nr:DUF1993 domain-containing protein [Pseudomonadota bacterium]